MLVSRFRSKRRQKGVSAVAVILGVVIVVCVFTAMQKIGEPYWDSHLIHKYIVEVLNTQVASGSVDPDRLARDIYNRAQIDNISVPPETVQTHASNDGRITVSVPFIVKVPLWSHATLVMDLSQSVSRPLDASSGAH